MVPRQLLGRLIATAALIGALVAAASVFATVTQRGGPARLRTQAFETGALSQSNSDDGSAIFTASNLGPGHSTEGTLTIANSGTVPGALALSMSNLTDSPGTNGGALSTVLDLQITDVSSGAGSDIYAGNLAGMPEQQLATLLPGDSRTYRFTATLPDHGTASTDWTDDNLYQRATTTVDYDWTFTQAGDAAPMPVPGPLPEVVQPSQVFTFGKPKFNKRTGTATVTVDVPGSGALVLRGKGVKTQRTASGAPGTVNLPVKATGRTRTQLNMAGRVRVKVKITFTPTGGASNPQSKRLMLIKTR
jgi:spore coat-associated protein N